MPKNLEIFFFILGIAVIIAIPTSLAVFLYSSAPKMQLQAAILASPAVSQAEDPSANAAPPQKKIKIVIVAGHDPAKNSGAQFNGVFESVLTAEIAQDLQAYLQSDSRFEVLLTRDSQGWNPSFEQYLKDNWNSIITWEKKSGKDLAGLQAAGLLGTTQPTLVHYTASLNNAIKLYGINKWGDDNNADLTVHIHLNDYQGRGWGKTGKYQGFAIYVPAKELSNSAATRPIAQSVSKELLLASPESNLPLEAGGIIEDPGLIAVGEKNTCNAASMLIEYGYIYEPRFTDPDLQGKTLQDLAYRTFMGLEDYFGVEGGTILNQSAQ